MFTICHVQHDNYYNISHYLVHVVTVLWWKRLLHSMMFIHLSIIPHYITYCTMVERVAAQHDVHSLINFPHYITYCTMVERVPTQHDVHSFITFPHYITYCTMVERFAVQHDVHSLINFPHYITYCTMVERVAAQHDVHSFIISKTTGNCDSEKDI